MEKNMEHEMETGITKGLKELELIYHKGYIGLRV